MNITNFIEIFITFKYIGVSDYTIRLRIIPFLLNDKTKMWLNSLSIKSWNEIVKNS